MLQVIEGYRLRSDIRTLSRSNPTWFRNMEMGDG